MNWYLSYWKKKITYFNTLIELEIQIKLFFFLSIIVLIILTLYTFFLTKNVFNTTFSNDLLNNFKTICLSIVITWSCLLFFIQAYTYLYVFDNFRLIRPTSNLTVIKPLSYSITFSLFSNNPLIEDIFTINVSKTSLIFSLLFSLLYPIIFFLMAYDFNEKYYKFYLTMMYIFFFSFFLVFTNNIIVFYFLYEIILILVFSVMYLSSNSRGGIEAALFFLGWAVLGSVLVSLGIIIFVVSTNIYTFSEVINHKLTTNELQTIYLLLFFGFGTKLSTWPFWYWLPRAHVEVSTGMSIFLSCILIKLSYYCLIKFQMVLGSEISYNLCILVTLLCIIDLTTRILNITDLKALVAYSSVIHTNILLALVHFDSFRVLNTNILYIWGHSISTACIFICINLIESRYGTRNPINLSGIYASSPLLGMLTLWSVIVYLDFPLTLFFWGELYFWKVLFYKIPLVGIQILFLMGIIFISIFFKYWWNVLYGAPNYNVLKVADVNYFELMFLLLGLLFILYFVGLVPSMLSTLVGSSLN